LTSSSGGARFCVASPGSSVRVPHPHPAAVAQYHYPGRLSVRLRDDCENCDRRKMTNLWWHITWRFFSNLLKDHTQDIIADVLLGQFRSFLNFKV